MKTLTFAVVLCVTNTSLAGRIDSGYFSFPQSAPPAALTWTLSTTDGRSVSTTMPDYEPPIRWQDIVVSPSTAAQYGIDWPAWQAALADPAYQRSSLTWDGVTQTGPVLVTSGTRQGFELDRLLFGISNFYWPVDAATVRQATVWAWAIDDVPVPEPSAVFLVLVALAALGGLRPQVVARTRTA